MNSIALRAWQIKAFQRDQLQQIIRPYPSRYRMPHPGQSLWVQERWGIFDTDAHQEAAIVYAADGEESECHWRQINLSAHWPGRRDENGDIMADEKFHHPRAMPQWASRYTIHTKDVFIEPWESVSQSQAEACGCSSLQEFIEQFKKDYTPWNSPWDGREVIRITLKPNTTP